MENTLNIPVESKVWIYQSPREFTVDELSTIDTEMKSFLATWESHGSTLQGHYQVLENRFIWIAVDEGVKAATGCSIDKSVGIIKKIEQALNLNLTDKGVVTYKSKLGDVVSSHFSLVKSLVEKGEITPETEFYNTSVATFGDFQSNWKIPAGHSWLSRYFK